MNCTKVHKPRNANCNTISRFDGRARVRRIEFHDLELLMKQNWFVCAEAYVLRYPPCARKMIAHFHGLLNSTETRTQHKKQNVRKDINVIRCETRTTCGTGTVSCEIYLFKTCKPKHSSLRTIFQITRYLKNATGNTTNKHSNNCEIAEI